MGFPQYGPVPNEESGIRGIEENFQLSSFQSVAHGMMEIFFPWGNNLIMMLEKIFVSLMGCWDLKSFVGCSSKRTESNPSIS